MRTATQSMLCITLAITIASCVLLPRRKLEVIAFSEDFRVDRWMIRSIQIENKSVLEFTGSQLPEILKSLAEKNGIQIIPQEQASDSEDEYGEIDLWIREKEFVKNLDTVNSITVILSIRSATTEKDILKAIYTEESHETVDSYYHLYSILEKLIKVVSKEIKK